MSHLAGRATELNSDVVSRRTNPGRTIIIHPGYLPEANVMALLRTLANRLFKSQIFFPAEKIEITNRSLVVRFSQNRINDDSKAAAKSQGIGRIPLCFGHRANDLFLCSDERDVEWIAGDIAGRVGYTRAVIEHGMSHFMMFPKARKNQISHYKIGESDAERDSRPDRKRSLLLGVGSRHGSATKPRFAAKAHE